MILRHYSEVGKMVINKELFQNTSNTGVITINTQGAFVEVNQYFLIMTGFKESDLLGESIAKVDSLSAKRIKATGIDSKFEHYHTTLKHCNGENFPVEVCLFPLQQEGNNLFTLMIKNVTDASLAQSNLSIIEQIFDNSNEAIVVADNYGFIQNVNKSFCTITGYAHAEVIGKNLSILKSGKQDKYFYKQFWQKLVNEGSWQGEIWNRRKSGEIYPEWLNISSIRNDDELITNYICQFSDITALKKSEEEKHFQAYHDSLTNLPNRHLLFERLSHLCELHSKSAVNFAVLFCDLDRFKLINDSLSHEAGDELLKSVALRFEAKLRDNDLLARIGGDEFIVVLEGEKALNNLDNICLQILSLFDQPFQTKFGEFKITISIGVSQFPADSNSVRELISFADVAMSKVKESGGNNYTLFDAREKTTIMHRLELEQEISQAIKNQHFELWYQPQINSQTNEVYGVECLLRWIHPEQGIISPALFIPIAEANGTIKELGHFVLKTAFKQLRQWRLSNVFTGIMAINVSIRQFDRNDLVAQVQELLAEEMIPANAIELEVTESLFSEDNTHLSPTLLAIRSLGMHIAIDDFGTGYSSLERLQRLPIDNVKIDKCFIDHIVHSKKDVAILKAIILLSKTFKFDLIAEGIETQRQAEKLNALGCYNHQGYLYSKPLRAQDFEVWLKEHKLKHGQLHRTIVNEEL